MTRRTRRVLGAGTATALALVGLGLAAGPAQATTPTGGCWVYSVPGGTPMEAVPTSDISSSLAPWTDTALAPAGPADYVLSTSGGTVVGSTRTFSMTINKGPKNGGPTASGTAYYYFSVNGVNQAPIAQAFSAAPASNIPGGTVTGTFTIAATGPTSVVFRKVIYDIPSFLTRVQCNGQSSGTQTGPNPATNPVDTNVVSAPFTAEPAPPAPPTVPGTIVTTSAGAVTGKLVVGKTLKAKKPATTPATAVTYAWLRNGKSIKGATKAKYTLVKKDKGDKISVRMTMTATGFTTLVKTIKVKGKVKAAN